MVKNTPLRNKLKQQRGRIKKQRAGDADRGSTFRRTEPFSSAVGVEPLQITKQTNLKPNALVGGACVIAASSRFFPLLSSSAGAGIWAALPVIFSVCYTSGIVHSVITTILAVTTVSTFGLAAFRCAGAPPMVVWGSYTVVGKGELKNYTFCRYCCKPKSPRAHHCRSCGMCILDMDHHCPFIGNCVGAANHRHFIAFLISAILSSIYASMISAYASFHIWPPLPLPLPLGSKTLHHLALFTTRPSTVAIREATLALIRSAMELPPRGLVLVYLFFASISVEISLIVLLWQQLCYIYDGRTHLSHLSYREGDPVTERDCQNLVRFFGCRCSILRFLPTLRNSRKRHKK
ncbi:hypothetical protein V6N13_012746 [Hibiscus sabdariffa]|uniref:S-acyltransferase n=1 Tax=Hibiscus sabdariffa TaxID=183260 RepID=A0ABR2SGW4_9ROSI